MRIVIIMIIDAHFLCFIYNLLTVWLVELMGKRPWCQIKELGTELSWGQSLTSDWVNNIILNLSNYVCQTGNHY